jgi:hypothetical protein
MPRYTLIATRNDCTGRFDRGEPALDAATDAGLEVYTRTWEDSYTAAYGRHYAVRTRHLKRLPAATRRAIRGAQ